MATTRVAMLQRLSEVFDDWWSDSTSSAGNAGGTTLIDTSLLNRPNGNDDDAFIGQYVRITSGTNNGEIRRVNAYTASSGTLTVESAFTGQVASGVTYELHKVHPTIKHNALTRAVERAFGQGQLYLPLRDETLVVDQLLTNGSFETALSGNEHPSWTRANHTAALSTSRVWHGTNSADITATAANATLSQNLFSSVNIHDVAGRTLYFKGRVWSANASDARLRVTFNGTTYTNGAYHAGSSEWEGPGTMYVAVTIPTTATEMTCFCWVVTNGNTAYFDELVAYIDPIYRYTIPTAMLALSYLNVQGNRDDATGSYRRLGLGQSPLPGRIIRLEGRGLISRPSTDAGTYEVDPPRTELLIAHAMWWMARNGYLSAAQLQRGNRAEEMQLWEAEVNRLTFMPEIRMPPMGAEIPEAWHIEEDSSGRYIMFDVRR